MSSEARGGSPTSSAPPRESGHADNGAFLFLSIASDGIIGGNIEGWPKLLFISGGPPRALLVHSSRVQTSRPPPDDVEPPRPAASGSEPVGKP